MTKGKPNSIIGRERHLFLIVFLDHVREPRQRIEYVPQSRRQSRRQSLTPVCIELNTLSQSNKVDIIQFFLNILGFFLRIGLGSQKEIDIALLRFLSVRSMRMRCCAFTLKLLIIRLVIGKCTLLKSFCKIIFICVFLSLTVCLQ